MTDDRSIALLRSANPVATGGPEISRSVEAEALRQRILAGPDASGPRTSSPRRRHALVAIAAIAAVALVVVALPASRVLEGLLPQDAAARAATPAPLATAHSPRRAGAAARLGAIADRIADLPDDVGSGPGVEVRYRTWSLFTRVDGVDVRSRVVPQEIRRELDADGTGTVTTRLVDDSGRVRTSTTPVREDAVVALPTTLAAMKAVLARRNPAGRSGRFNAVVETLLERPAGPAARSALLRYLARTAGLESVGQVRDRLGRPGTGFAVESDASGLPTRYLLVVDPRTGVVLDYEETLTRDAGKLDVAVPSVIQYVAWRESRFTDG